MRVVCNKNILIQNINIVLKAVTTKTTLPILECILLIADRKGFRLMSNDLELSIETANMDCDVFDLGTVAVDAKIFSNIIKSMPGDTVSIETDENNLTFIKSDRSEFKIPGQPGNKFPMPPEVEKNQAVNIKSIDFKNMVRKTIFSVATEEIRPVLTGEFIEIEGKYLNIVAIDGYRISYRRIKLENFDNYIEFVVPAKTLNEITKIGADDDTKINMYFTDRHILFEMEECTIVSRLLEGEYLDYKSNFMQDYKTKVTINKNMFLSSLERSLLISKENKKTPVKLTINKDIMDIYAVTELGEVYDQIPIDFQGDELVIGFNPKYLIDVVRSVDEEEIDLYFTGGALAPCIIKNENVDDEFEKAYKYLVLPLKL